VWLGDHGYCRNVKKYWECSIALIISNAVICIVIIYLNMKYEILLPLWGFFEMFSCSEKYVVSCAWDTCNNTCKVVIRIEAGS
jgi:hypothetical protein